MIRLAIGDAERVVELGDYAMSGSRKSVKSLVSIFVVLVLKLYNTQGHEFHSCS